jgi:hypothetical protein
LFYIVITHVLSPPSFPSSPHTHTHTFNHLYTHTHTHNTEEWNNVRNIVARAEHTVITTSSPDDILMDGDTTSLQSVTTFYQPKLRVALGLAHLAEGKYTDAAIIFTSLTIELNTQFATVISAEDIALYGSILGLATMDRELLHGCVIDGIFKGRLEVCVCDYFPTSPLFIESTPLIFLFSLFPPL